MAWPSQSQSIVDNSGVAIAFLDGVASSSELPFLKVLSGYVPLFENNLIPPERKGEFDKGFRYFSVHIKGAVKNLAWIDPMTGRPLTRYAIDMAHGLAERANGRFGKLSCTYDHRQARLRIGEKEFSPVVRIWNGLEDPAHFIELHRRGEWGVDMPRVPTKVTGSSIDILIGFDAEMGQAAEFSLQLGKIGFCGCEVVVPEIMFGQYDAVHKEWLS